MKLPVSPGLLAVDPNEKMLAVSDGHTLMILDPASGMEKLCLKVEGDEEYSCIQFSSNGSMLAYATQDDVFLCDVGTGQTLISLTWEKGEICDLAFTHNGKYLLVAHEFGAVSVCKLHWHYAFDGFKSLTKEALPYLQAFVRRNPIVSRELVRIKRDELRNCGFGCNSEKEVRKMLTSTKRSFKAKRCRK